MAVEAVMQEEIEVPEGGIAELVMDDQTADEIYGADEDEVPSGGIAQFESVAEQMAAMGREGDDMLAHLETGELVIPRRFLEENEEFKSYVMAFFEGQGVDPDRYIAGSDANSLNPETGIAEFFFKKLFKKIKKGVKKVGKAVKKVVKKGCSGSEEGCSGCLTHSSRHDPIGSNLRSRCWWGHCYLT